MDFTKVGVSPLALSLDVLIPLSLSYSWDYEMSNPHRLPSFDPSEYPVDDRIHSIDGMHNRTFLSTRHGLRVAWDLPGRQHPHQ